MLVTRPAGVGQPAPDKLVSFLNAIPDGRFRRYPRCLLLMAVLGILSGCPSSRDL
jgi:hypothetical protein